MSPLIWHPKCPLLPHPGSSSDVNCGLEYVQTQYLNKQCHWAAFIQFPGSLHFFVSHQDMSMSQSDGTGGLSSKASLRRANTAFNILHAVFNITKIK